MLQVARILYQMVCDSQCDSFSSNIQESEIVADIFVVSLCWLKFLEVYYN